VDVSTEFCEVAIEDSFIDWRICNDYSCPDLASSGTVIHTDEAALLQVFETDRLGKRQESRYVYDILFPKDTTSRSSFDEKIVPGAVALTSSTLGDSDHCCDNS
jgi:hypothetical protein